MNEEYTWGLRRHELFIKGGTSRHKLLNEGGLRGAMDARSVDELLVLLEYWCLGVRGRDFIGDGSEENQAAVCQPRESSQNGSNGSNGAAEALESVLEVGSRETPEIRSPEPEAQVETPHKIHFKGLILLSQDAVSGDAAVDIPQCTDEPTTENPQDAVSGGTAVDIPQRTDGPAPENPQDLEVGSDT